MILTDNKTNTKIMNNAKKDYWQRQSLKSQILRKYAMGYTYDEDYTRLKKKYPFIIYYSVVTYCIDLKYLSDIKQEFKQNKLRLHIDCKYDGLFNVVIKCKT